MSGPDLPRLAAGSNSIGEFEIGVSMIGDIPAFDVWTTVLSQYANSPIITQLVQNFAGYVDQTKDLSDFFDLIWNVDTAQGYGLDVWGRIVGVNRILEIFGPVNYFGFKEAGDAKTFGQAQFFDGEPLTTSYRLTDQAYRTLIIAKAIANITLASYPALNQMLLNLFPHRGNCYVTDGVESGSWFGFAESQNAVGFGQAAFYDGQSVTPGMHMTYTFDFPLTPVEMAIVQNSGVLPKPTGVNATVVINL